MKIKDAKLHTDLPLRGPWNKRNTAFLVFKSKKKLKYFIQIYLVKTTLSKIFKTQHFIKKNYENWLIFGSLQISLSFKMCVIMNILICRRKNIFLSRDSQRLRLGISTDGGGLLENQRQISLIAIVLVFGNYTENGVDYKYLELPEINRKMEADPVVKIYLRLLQLLRVQ